MDDNLDLLDEDVDISPLIGINQRGKTTVCLIGAGIDDLLKQLEHFGLSLTDTDIINGLGIKEYVKDNLDETFAGGLVRMGIGLGWLSKGDFDYLNLWGFSYGYV